MERSIAAIDLKSFYATVECIERGLDPFSTPKAATSNPPIAFCQHIIVFNGKKGLNDFKTSTSISK